MERIKTFIQKLQEVYYSKHPKSAIDIDLMLDYTRIMYIDLLEWRKEFTDPIHSDIAGLREANNVANANEAIEKETDNSSAQIKEAPKSIVEDAPPKEITSQPAANTAEASIDEKAEALTEEMEEEVFQENKEILPEAPKETTPEVVDTFPEEESIAIISQEHSGISFELPAQPEKSFVLDEILAEEAPVAMNNIEEIPLPAVSEIPLPEFKPYNAAKLFDSITELKDIRTSIGINDKYLFLNELFNNHKSDYEETLDKINRFANVEEANDWIKTKAPVAKNWDKNDTTVQSFYALLGKHFSSK